MNDAVTMRQGKVVMYVLDDAGLLACKPQPRTMSPRLDLNETTVRTSKEDANLYRGCVGSLSYLPTKSGLDLRMVASTLESHIMDPTESQMKGVRQALRYMKGSYNTGLNLSPGGIIS